MLGEHTVEVLELAGYETDEIDRFLESGAVVAFGPPSVQQQQDGA
jgi:hypothetical protein